jgi:hypothetical protein
MFASKVTSKGRRRDYTSEGFVVVFNLLSKVITDCLNAHQFVEMAVGELVAGQTIAG